MGKASLASIHTAVSILAGLMSVAGAVYSAVRFVRPATGEVIAVVRAARTDKPLPGTAIEVLTPEDALVVNLTASDDGSARHELAEGAYRVRAAAPRFNAQTRDVRVQRGATAEIRFELAQLDEGSAADRKRRSAIGAHPVSRGVGAAQRFLHRLGL